MPMTRERLWELQARYTAAVKGSTKKEELHQWLRYLTFLWKEDEDPQIFLILRQPARSNGGRLAQQFAEGQKTLRELFHGIRKFCMDEYASSLNAYGIADIDTTSEPYRLLTKKIAFEVLQAFKGVDPADKTAMCVSMAMNWHHFVKLLHAEHGLPTVRELKDTVNYESDAEKTVLDRADFETKMTRTEREEWEGKVLDVELARRQ